MKLNLSTAVVSRCLDSLTCLWLSGCETSPRIQKLEGGEEVVKGRRNFFTKSPLGSSKNSAGQEVEAVTPRGGLKYAYSPDSHALGPIVRKSRHQV